MITVIIPEWVIWLAIGAIIISIVLSIISIILRMILLNIEKQIKKQNHEILSGYDKLGIGA